MEKNRMNKDSVPARKAQKERGSTKLVLDIVCIILVAVGGALFPVMAAVKGVDINALMFYVWRLGIQNLDHYEVVTMTAAKSFRWAIVVGVIALYIWISYWTRHSSISLRVSLRERQVRLLPVPFHVKRRWPLVAGAWVFFLGTVLATLYTIQVPQYFLMRRESVPLYTEKYVDASTLEFTFPQKKRNLIHIFIESMESTFEDKASGGGWDDNHIPYLTELAENNISFSDMYQVAGTGYTSGGLVAQSAGIPISGVGDDFGWVNQGGAGNTEEVINLYDILSNAGYQQLFLCGSNGEFGERAIYFTEHGVDMWDYYSAIEEGKIPEDYKSTWWGFEDAKLYEYTKEKVTEMAESDEPFSITLLTVDTHASTYYVCEQCPDEYPTDYENIYRCADNQVRKFIKWLEEQDFYEDTTIIITGDHLNMDGYYFEVQGIKEEDRRIYNCIINPAEGLPRPEKDRALTSIDIFPTTLRAMGVTWEGSRLGLGTDMFSGEQTLAEELGMELLNGSVLAYQKDLFDTILTDLY